MLDIKFEELKKEFLNEEIDLLDLEGIGDYSLDYIFPDDEVFNLKIGKYNKKLEGSYSYKNEFCEENEAINLIFETVGEWEVIDNSRNSNIYLTYINEKSVIIKITEISIV